MDTSAMAYHARSNSLPSRPNPIVPQAEECLCRLRVSESASTSTSLSQKLNTLQELHDCVDELLLLPLTRQAIAYESIDELLDESVKLLDVCNVIKEALLQTKEYAQEIQSVLRRRCDSRADVKKFMSARKVVKKATQKALKNLKCTGSKRASVNETIALLGEAQAHTVIAFESLLAFINGRKASARSIVSKIMSSKRVAFDEEEVTEFAKADCAVQSLVGGKGSAENVQNQLKELDLCIQDFEDGVESLFRRLIKTRVSLLNIVNH